MTHRPRLKQPVPEPEKPSGHIISTSIEHDARPNYGIGGFIGYSRPGGSHPYRVKLELIANDAFVQRLMAFFHGEGVDVPGRPETRAERTLTQGLPALPAGPPPVIEGTLEDALNDVRAKHHPNQTSRTLDDPGGDAPFGESFDDDYYDDSDCISDEDD